MEKKDKEFIYYRESVVQSVLADISTFAIVIGSLYIGVKYLGGNGWAMFFLWGMALLAVAAKANAKKVTFTDKEALLKHIKETL